MINLMRIKINIRVFETRIWHFDIRQELHTSKLPVLQVCGCTAVGAVRVKRCLKVVFCFPADVNIT
jgi:hypothetical protein